jgi:hypothetical protein
MYLQSIVRCLAYSLLCLQVKWLEGCRWNLITFKRANFPTFFLLLAFILSACGTATSTAETQVVDVYATSAAQPWLTKLYACAADSGAVLNINAESPEIYLRVGEPDVLVSSAYQIGQEEILIVTPRESSVQNLTLSEAQELFAKGDSSAQVWVYASDADMQEVFDQLVMQGRSVSSSARIAVSVQNMTDVIKAETSAIGILPRHSVTNDVREVYSAGTVPVLAFTKSKAEGVIVDLISCMENN